jgi:DNA-binding response OmpR family regulator
VEAADRGTVEGAVTERSAVSQRQRVLVVDDEAEIVEILRDYLQADGFTVLTATDGASALAILAREMVDCVLLDVMMPGPSGFEVCRQIRTTSDVPILFLTARDTDMEKIRGLGLADDYIVKSASPAEVVARVRAVMRRAQRDTTRDDGILDFGRLLVDVRAHEVRVNGTPVPMTAREFALLRLLAEHPRQVFSRDHLFESVWGEYGDESTVWVHIRRVREKIEEDPSHPELIVTVWGVGYRFDGERR